MVSIFRIIDGAIIIGTFLYTLITQLIVVFLTIKKIIILAYCQFIPFFLFVEIMVVGAVVSDVQTTVAIHQGEVTITIESTNMSGSDGDEVAVIDIMDRGRYIAIY